MAVVAVPFTAFDDTAGGVPAVVLDSVPLQAEFAMRHGAEVLLLGVSCLQFDVVGSGLLFVVSARCRRVRRNVDVSA